MRTTRWPRRDTRKAFRLIGSGLRQRDGTDVQEFLFPSGATGRFYPALRDRVRLAKQAKEARDTAFGGGARLCEGEEKARALKRSEPR